MGTNYELNIENPDLQTVGYIIVTADLKEKRDRSAPSNFHWKVLKCRMMIFSNSLILASPDKNDIKVIHVIFNKIGEDYDKVNSLLLKFSLQQDGAIKKTTPDVFQMCFQYTMTAKLAPVWNVLGQNYLINNRDFLTTEGPQDGIQYNISCTETQTTLYLKPVKINFLKSDEDYYPGEWIRVLPSLFKATIDDCHNSIPMSGDFKSYKDLRRHWKNIHGYRLPEDEGSYCTVQFWRGEPLTYPKICLTRHFPIITPMPKPSEKVVLDMFVSCLKNKMSQILGIPLTIDYENLRSDKTYINNASINALPETQAVSLCTPTQMARTSRNNYFQ